MEGLGEGLENGYSNRQSRESSNANNENPWLKKFHQVDEDTEATIHVKKGLGRKKGRQQK